MKKNLLLIGALAFVGLFASCQKENVATESVTPEQPAVVTVDLDGLKSETDLEPLAALGEAVLQSEAKSWGDVGEDILKFLKWFYSTVGNYIGATSMESPIHTFQSFGDWDSFGCAIDQIRQKSYNFGDAQSGTAFIKIQSGDAPSLKISGLESFSLNLQAQVTKAPKYDAGLSKTDALLVKFDYKRRDYVFMIYSEATAGIHNADTGTGVHFGFIFGDFRHIDKDCETLIKWYRKCVLKNDNVGTVSSLKSNKLPVDPSLALVYNLTLNHKQVAAVYGDFSWEVVTDRNEGTLALGTKSGMYYGDWRAVLQSPEPDAVEDFARDLLLAAVVGVDESECNSVVAQFHELFCLGGSNQLKLYGLKYVEPNYTEGIYRSALELKAQGASGLVHKPAFGVDFRDGSFESFDRIRKMDETEGKAFWAAYTVGGLWTDFEPSY